MEISSSGYINDPAPFKKNPRINKIGQEGPKRSANEAASTRNKGNRIEISSRAKEIERAMKVVKQAPDIRTSKVETIKRAVDSGTYNVKSEKTAEKLLKEIQQELSGF